jgi:replicative DNA helicase|tara:strand:+ start:3128 stop:4477 length:1350 start_codon:yes stop_codon:yes gene_type:complete
MTDRLSSYGYSFQIKVIASLFTDKLFINQIAEILSPKYFESDANNWIVETVLEYHREFKTSPTLEVIKVKQQDLDHDVLKEQIVAHMKDAWRYIEADDLPFIKQQAIDFCKNQEIKKAILGSVDLLKHGQYDEIKTKIDDALKSGGDKDIGHDYMVSIDERYTDAVRDTKETPWEVINDLTDGGLGKGELAVFVAPAGIGKSWGLINIGAHAIKKGMTVLHYTLELNQAYVGLRYDSVVTGIANQNLKHYQSQVKEALEKMDGELIIKHYPTKSVGVLGLRSHVEKCIMQDKKPDIIIVDYADLLKGHGQEKRHELEGIYEDLRGMAGEYDIPVWTASQANRSALEEDVIDASKVSESYGKVMVADFILSLSRKVQDKLAGTGRWHVIKNRFGPDGITLPSKMNTSNGQIHIYTDTSVQGKDAQKQMDNGEEYTRKLLSRKFQEIQGFE